MRKSADSKTKKKRSVFAAIVLLFLAGLIFGLIGFRHQAKIVFVFPEMTRVDVIEDDPIAKETKNLVANYQAWLDANPDDSGENNAIGAYVQLHNRYAKRCQKLGVNVPLVDKNMVESGKYPELIEPVVCYLEEKGWAAGFTVPVESGASGQKTRAAAFCYIGQIHSRRKKTTTSTSGKDISFEQEVVYKTTKVKLGRFKVSSITKDGRMRHFLDDLVDSAEDVATTCRKVKAKEEVNDRQIFDALQWILLYEEEGNSSQFCREVVSDLLRSEYRHEEQHIRDFELTKAVTSTKYSYPETTALVAFLESRGLLASVANSEAPLYAVGHLQSWQNNPVPINHIAGELAIAYLGKIPIDANKEFGETIKLCNARGKEALAKSDQDYLELIKHLHEQTPFESMVKIRQKESK